MEFTRDVLRIDPRTESNRISAFIKNQLLALHREGIVIGLSGGVDSALCAALSIRAAGNRRVLGLLLPEKESSPQSAELATRQAKNFGIETITEDITPVLIAFGTYEKRDAIAKAAYPEYDDQYKLKMTLPADILNNDNINFFSLTIVDPQGATKRKRLNSAQARGIIAATSTKHRARMMVQYYYAEKSNYLVCGTTNKSEALLGLFVKYGDGGVDIEPIAHLFKSQVYQLAEHVGVIPEILERAPCPDTYSAPVTDEEWYCRMPYNRLDGLLYAWENKIDMPQVCHAMKLTEEQVKRAFRDFSCKFNATRHLTKMPPSLP